jgi:hypothetical protein
MRGDRFFQQAFVTQGQPEIVMSRAKIRLERRDMAIRRDSFIEKSLFLEDVS